MNAITKTALVVAIAMVAVLLLLLGSGSMTLTRPGDGMMGSGAMGGFSWIWMSVLLLVGCCALLVWVIVGRKKRPT